MTNSQNVQIPAENLIPVFTAEICGISTLAVNARDLTSFLVRSGILQMDQEKACREQIR